jgi:hypothetical protein
MHHSHSNAQSKEVSVIFGATRRMTAKHLDDIEHRRYSSAKEMQITALLGMAYYVRRLRKISVVL